jgi:hypothetical protein
MNNITKDFITEFKDFEFELLKINNISSLKDTIERIEKLCKSYLIEITDGNYENQ